MAENPTTGELYKAKAILEADVVAAVDAFMADPTTSLFVFGDGSGLTSPRQSGRILGPRRRPAAARRQRT